MIALLFSPLGKIIAVAVAVAAILGGVYLKGRSDGASSVQAKWDAAVQAAIERGEGARRDAERDVERGVPDDKFNRD